MRAVVGLERGRILHRLSGHLALDFEVREQRFVAGAGFGEFAGEMVRARQQVARVAVMRRVEDLIERRELAERARGAKRNPNLGRHPGESRDPALRQVVEKAGFRLSPE
jgi:hypothetical protein